MEKKNRRKMKTDKIEKFIPGVKWINGYSMQFAISDLIAGITVGLTILPQALAYSTLAGLEPQYGLYSSFIGGFIYALVGGCPEVNIGPTALLALMTSRHTGLGARSGPDYAILLCLLAGIVEFLMACLKLGALVDLISLPVTVGFTSATAVIIGTSQIKGLLGLKGGSGASFLDTIGSVFSNIDKVRIPDFTLGIASIIVLLALRKLKSFSFDSNKKVYKIINGCIWTISTARNALLVLITSCIAYSAQQSGPQPFILTGSVKSGFPRIGLPNFETDIPGANGTLVHQTFPDMVAELGPSIVVVPIIAVLGNVAISKAFGGAGLNPTKELIALSLSNIVGSLFSSFPVTGSFSRSAVNHASGVRTPIGGIYTGVLVLLAVGILTPYFHYIPKAALSAVIISAVIFMIEYEVVKPLWKCSRRELLPGAVTFILSLCLGVEIGLSAGVATDLAFLIHRSARPILSVAKSQTHSGLEYVLISPKHSLIYFPAIEWVRSGVSKAVREYGMIPVVMDCRNLNEFDFTAARGMGSLSKDLSAMGVRFFLLGAGSAIKMVLKEATGDSICTLETVDELESFAPNGDDNELKEVVAPLLKNRNNHKAEKRK
ncbi:sodium-independent sulfate anion transporter isoform X2 [Hermetia illucens]|nr:sodium-independent sulfate anion transporter isoform X2 [Hermetia illucens]